RRSQRALADMVVVGNNGGFAGMVRPWLVAERSTVLAHAGCRAFVGNWRSGRRAILAFRDVFAWICIISIPLQIVGAGRIGDQLVGGARPRRTVGCRLATHAPNDLDLRSV